MCSQNTAGRFDSIDMNNHNALSAYASVHTEFEALLSALKEQADQTEALRIAR